MAEIKLYDHYYKWVSLRSSVFRDVTRRNTVYRSYAA